MKKAMMIIAVALAVSGCGTNYYFYTGRYFKLVKNFDSSAMYVLDRKGNWVEVDQRPGFVVVSDEHVTHGGQRVDAGLATAEAGKRHCAATVTMCARNAIGLPTEAGSGGHH